MIVSFKCIIKVNSFVFQQWFIAFFNNRIFITKNQAGKIKSKDVQQQQQPIDQINEA